MKITIQRYCKKSQTIDGRLYIDGVKVCDTAENANFAIPSGNYKVEIVKCKQYARKQLCIIVNGSPDCKNCERLECVSLNTTMPRFCPQLKAGNGVYNRKDGSIILGTRICPGCLKRTKQAFNSVFERLRKSIERGHEVTLTIISYKL